MSDTTATLHLAFELEAIVVGDLSSTFDSHIEALHGLVSSKGRLLLLECFLGVLVGPSQLFLESLEVKA